jgi:hypothetical protein
MSKSLVIEPNLRTLKRDEGGVFTLTALDRVKDVSLCDRCCKKGRCPILARREREGDEAFVKTMIVSCGWYVAPLFFHDKTGLNSESFNTFRLGGAWTHRVKEGDRVGLIYKPTMELISMPKVSGLFYGDKDLIISKHSHLNHTYIEQNLSIRTAAMRMRKLLPTLFGPLIYKQATKMTAIYFK